MDASVHQGTGHLCRAQVLPKEEFKREVERHLTGKETEAREIIYFKLYKSQLPVVEKALESAGSCLALISGGLLP